MRIRSVVKTVVPLSGLAMVLMLLFGALYERQARAADLRRFPPPGTMISVGDHALHLDCRGSGRPTLVLESGMDPLGSIAWSLVHDRLAAVTRTCAYDRAGIAWSEQASGPRYGSRIAAELRELLRASKEPGPFLLVGHSMGGPYARIFAGAYPNDLAGLVLMESSHPEQFERMPENRTFRPPPQLLIAAMPLLRRIGIARHLMIEELRFRSLPDEKQEVVLGVSAGSIATVLSEFASIRESLSEAAQVGSVGDLRLTVLSSTDPPDATRIPELDQQQANEGQAAWLALQDELVDLSTRSQYVPIANATHYMQFSNPDAVVDALTMIVEEARGRLETASGNTL